MANTIGVDQPIIIQPGSCGPQPPNPPGATEIECISVNKVYDFCFQPESLTRSFVISAPGDICCLCPSTTPANGCSVGTAIPCNLGLVSCAEVNRTATGTGGFAMITLQVRVEIDLFPVGTTFPTITEPCVTEIVTFTKRVILCAPEGTVVDCDVTGACDCVILSAEAPTSPGGPTPSITIECSLDFCVVVKTIAQVNLLVPALGFCVPAECATFGFSCPPTPPAQCLLTS